MLIGKAIVLLAKNRKMVYTGEMKTQWLTGAGEKD